VDEREDAVAKVGEPITMPPVDTRQPSTGSLTDNGRSSAIVMRDPEGNEFCVT
jgi:hypothetical protein